MGTPLPLPKKGPEPPKIFGPFLLWPNGWMHQDATWYGDRPQPRGLCVRWRPSLLPKMGAEPPIFGQYLLRSNGCKDQDATWYEGRTRPRRLCVKWGPRSRSPKRGRSPQKFPAHFYCGQTAGCIKMPLGMEIGLCPGDFVLDGDPASSPKRGRSPSPMFGPFLLRPNGLMHQDATWYGGRPHPRGLCVRL